MSKKGMSGGTVAAIGASAIAIGATAYYFLGPKGKKHQKSAKKWTMEAKRKIIREIEKGKEMTESLYGKIVDNVLKPYIARGATAREVLALAKALKNDWKHIVKTSKSALAKNVAKAKGKTKKKRG